VSEYRSEPILYTIRSPGGLYTRTTISGMVEWKSPNQSRLGGLSAGHPVGLYEYSYNALDFAVR